MKHPIVELDFRDESSRSAVLRERAVRTSAAFGWQSLYFEHRSGQTLETVEHVIYEHYLMVKLNPFSRAERALDGKAQREIQRRGTTAYVPSGCPHRVRYDGSLGSLHLMTLQPALVEAVASELNVPHRDAAPHFACEEEPFVLATAELIDAELRQGNPHGPLFADTLARALAAHLVTRWHGPDAAPRKLPALGPRQLGRLDDYIDAHIADPINLAELAGQTGLSAYYFCRCFKRATGLTPWQYVLKKRIQFACERLLENGLPVQDVAFESGFGDPVQFARQFRRAMGVTPTAWRAQNQA